MKYKTITLGPGTKFLWTSPMWEWLKSPENSKKDANGFEYNHILISGTVIIKIEDQTEEEHEKENIMQNPTGKRMIQL